MKTKNLMKKLSILLPLLFLVSTLFAKTDKKFDFRTTPYLQNMTTNAVSVYWLTNKSCTSYIKYGETKELNNKAVSSKNGQIDANSQVQKIRIENLEEGKTYYYQTVSKEIKTYKAYKVIYGDSILSAVHSFTLPKKHTDSFSFLAFNDVHDRPAYIEDVCKENPKFDFVFLNGDILNDIYNEEQILNGICRGTSKAFATEKPFFYTRGNHETRGPESRTLKNYIESPGEDYYYSFTWGNTFFLVLDTGEDKEDDNKYYFGLADYDAYRAEQAEWIKRTVKTKAWRNAKHHIVCGHIPISLKKDNQGHGANDLANKIAPILNKAKIDLYVCGHTHRSEILRPNEYHNYPLVIGGAPIHQNKGKNTTFIRITVNKREIAVELRHKDGELLDQYLINPHHS